MHKYNVSVQENDTVMVQVNADYVRVVAGRLIFYADVDNEPTGIFNKWEYVLKEEGA